VALEAQKILEEIDKSRSISELLDKVSNIDEGTLQNSIGRYSGALVTREGSQMASYNAADIPDIMGIYNTVEDIRDSLLGQLPKHLMLSLEKINAIPKDFTGDVEKVVNNLDLDKLQDVLKECCVLNEINGSGTPMLTSAGIHAVWSNVESINRGNKEFLVSMPDPAKMYDETRPSATINLDQCTQDQFDKKLKYAATQNPEGSCALTVTRGGHWTLLAVDNASKKYRFIDSQGGDIHKDLKSLIDGSNISGYENVTQLVQQQHDSSSCGYWCALNAGSVVEHGIDVKLQPQSQAQENSLMDSVKLQSFKTFIGKIALDHKKEDGALKQEEVQAALDLRRLHSGRELKEVVSGLATHVSNKQAVAVGVPATSQRGIGG
jgi:hypothetical protein